MSPVSISYIAFCIGSPLLLNNLNKYYVLFLSRQEDTCTLTVRGKEGDSSRLVHKMASGVDFYSTRVGDTVFRVLRRYQDLTSIGSGAQGVVV